MRLTMTPAENPTGHDKGRYCGGPKKQSEGTCTRPAGWGTPHPGEGRCKLHGGSTPSHVKAAQTGQARRAVDTYGLPRDISPDRALLDEVARTAGHVDWLADKVRALAPEDLVWSKAKAERITASETPGTNVTVEAQAHVWVQLYHWERKHLVDVSKAAIAAGIAERQVRLAEQHGRLIADVLRKVFADDDLALTEQQRGAVPAVVRRHLAVA